VSCEKVADWIWMPFEVVSGDDPGIGVLDGVHMPQEEGEVLGVFLPSGVNGIFECTFKTEMYSTRA